MALYYVKEEEVDSMVIGHIDNHYFLVVLDMIDVLFTLEGIVYLKYD